MPGPIVVDIPHSLGREEARRRIAANTDKLASQIPGGADVRSAWSGDRLSLNVKAMGQEISAYVDVGERAVRLELLLPPALSFFGRGIEALLRRKGEVLLEDKSKG